MIWLTLISFAALFRQWLEPVKSSDYFKSSLKAVHFLRSNALYHSVFGLLSGAQDEWTRQTSHRSIPEYTWKYYYAFDSRIDAHRYINKGQKYRKQLQRRKVKPLLAFAAIRFGTPLFTTFSIYKGLPPTLNYFLGEPGSIHVTVRGKYRIHNTKNCKGMVLLAEYRAFSNNYFCGIHEITGII